MKWLPTTIIAILFSALSTNAQECPELIGDWPFGPTSQTEAEGNLAYFSSGAALMIADVSDPQTPTVAGSLALGGPMEDLKVADGFVYITDQAGERLVVVDATNAAEPVIAGTLTRTTDNPNGGWYALDVANGHLVIPDYNTVRVIDVSNPADPAEVGFYEFGVSTNITAVVASGRFVFLGYSGDLVVLDVDNPTSPVETGRVELPGTTWSLALSGNLLSAACGSAGIGFFDVSDPANPSETSVLATNSNVTSVAAGQDVVFWSRLYIDVFSVDVSDPLNPVEVGVVSVSGNVVDLAVSNNHVVAAASTGLAVIDASEPSQLEVISIVDTPTAAEDIQMVEELAFVATGTTGLRVLDTADPGSPQQIGFLEARYSVESIGMSGDYLFLVDEGLRAVDIGDPSHPIEVGFATLSSSYNARVEASGEQAVVAVYGGVEVFDISDPTAPAGVSSLNLASATYPAGTAVAGDSLFLVSNNTLYTIDFSVPSTPVLIGEFDLPGSADAYSEVVISSDVAFIASNRGTYCFDVSDPTAPIELSLINGAVAGGIDIWENYLVISRQDWLGVSRVDVVDVAYPTNPTTVGSHELSSIPSVVSMSEGVAAVGTTEAGVSFFDLNPCASIPPTADFSYEPEHPKSDSPVQFTDLSSGPTEWSWDFGDGGTSSEQHPSYVYQSSGQFTVSLTATNDWGSDSTSTQVIVEPSGDRVFIPAVGIGPGAGDSFWSSDVVVNNRGDVAISYEIQYLKKGEDNTAPASEGPFSLAPGMSVSYQNILDVFGVSAGSGALSLVMDDSSNAVVMSRTKSTDSQGATFGQGIPPVFDDRLFRSDEYIRLIGLSETAALRTNIGFLNGSSQSIWLRVDFYDSEDNLLGSETLQLEPFSCEQWNRAFNRVGAGGTDNGWVEVSLSSDRGGFFTYASVVDNLKDDPTFVLPQIARVASSSRIFVPASGVGAGVGTSSWSTDVVVSWRTTGLIPFTATFLPKGQDNSAAPSVALSTTTWANNGRSLLFEDILADLFDLQSGSGALVFDFDFESSMNDYVLLSSRTKNTDADGATFGQGIPAVDEADLVPHGERVRLVQLAQNSELRTNIGFMNGSDAPITLNVEFFDQHGALLGTDSLVLQTYSFEQWNRAFKRVSSTAVDNGYVDVWTTTPEGRFYSFASVIDMVKDDPTYVMPQ